MPTARPSPQCLNLPMPPPMKAWRSRFVFAAALVVACGSLPSVRAMPPVDLQRAAALWTQGDRLRGRGLG